MSEKKAVNEKLFKIFDKKFRMMWKQKYPYADDLTKDWHVYVCSLGAHLIKNQYLPLKCGSQTGCGYETAEMKYIPDPATLRGTDDIDYIVLNYELAEKILVLGDLP